MSRTVPSSCNRKRDTDSVIVSVFIPHLLIATELADDRYFGREGCRIPFEFQLAQLNHGNASQILGAVVDVVLYVFLLVERGSGEGIGKILSIYLEAPAVGNVKQPA